MNEYELSTRLAAALQGPPPFGVRRPVDVVCMNCDTFLVVLVRVRTGPHEAPLYCREELTETANRLMGLDAVVTAFCGVTVGALFRVGGVK